MNKRDRKYASLMREGITSAIRRTVHAGFRVDAIEVRKKDLRLLRNSSPTRTESVAGVLLRESEDHDLEERHFRIITNTPPTREDAKEMFEKMRMELPKEGLRFKELNDEDMESDQETDEET